MFQFSLLLTACDSQDCGSLYPYELDDPFNTLKLSNLFSTFIGWVEKELPNPPFDISTFVPCLAVGSFPIPICDAENFAGEFPAVDPMTLKKIFHYFFLSI